MAGGTYLDSFLPGHVEATPYVESGDVVSGVVGANSDLVAQFLQRPDFFEDSDMATVIGKEGSRSDREYSVHQACPPAGNIL